jgi:cytochrome d ubiquinol oxidase subunit II
MNDLFTLPNLVAAAIVAALNFYVLLAGADFGGGVWDLLATGPRRDAQRALIVDAMSPVWEANHVWLILAIVLLFTCFPPAFALLGILLHIPLTLMLIGIVLRGSAFTFRAYGSQRDAVQTRWGRIFAIASVVTPVLLGICVGAIASGALGTSVTSGTRSFTAVYVRPWLTPFAVGNGLLALTLFAFLAAVYLTVEAREDRLREDFRRRALITSAVVFVIAFGLLAIAHRAAPLMREALVESPFAMPFHIATGAAAIAAIAFLWTRRWRLARLAAAAQVSLILWGWAAGQYPHLVPPTLTIEDAAAPPQTIRLVLLALIVGSLVLFPSLWYLIRVFKGRLITED